MMPQVACPEQVAAAALADRLASGLTEGDRMDPQTLSGQTVCRALHLETRELQEVIDRTETSQQQVAVMAR